jgi:hypothetical protein
LDHPSSSNVINEIAQNKLVWAASANNPGKCGISLIGCQLKGLLSYYPSSFLRESLNESEVRKHKQATALSIFLFPALALFAFMPLMWHSVTSNLT